MPKRQFASDNHAPIVREVIEQILRANTNHAPAYGEDQITRNAKLEIARFLGRGNGDTDNIQFVPTGTGANVLCLSSFCQTWEAVLCHELSHMNTDECAAPELTGHLKLLPLTGDFGKIDLNHAASIMNRVHGIHGVKPTVISVTQVTELGTVYSLEELAAIRDFADEHNLKLHIDGARLFNALITLGIDAPTFIKHIRPDALSLGGTKIGGMICEAAYLFDYPQENELIPEYLRKQMAQLVSKGRFISAQWLGLLRDDVALRYAAKANAMAELLENKIAEADVRILQKREANSLFVELWPDEAETLLEKGWLFYNFLEPRQYRLMTSWDTEESDIDEFIEDIKPITAARTI
ncbi:aminotransferase class I/II-fold pyridoxal phosphate-dependent enzyme [Planctomycetota bacterium]|nr:aminotransferase class I/II-fold pyridoxal phosphate-dependent enzyme [Planctomycetota bacterium]